MTTAAPAPVSRAGDRRNPIDDATIGHGQDVNGRESHNTFVRGYGVLKYMPASDIAREKVVTVAPEASLSEVVQTMRSERVGSVVVLDGDEPVGLVSDRDLAMVVLDGETDAETTAVASVLDDELTTIPADTGVYELVEELSRKGLRRAPLVDEDDDLVGIVSISDVVVLLGMELQQVANTIRTVSPAYERSATEIYD